MNGDTPISGKSMVGESVVEASYQTISRAQNQVTYNQYYRTFDEFQHNIKTFFQNLDQIQHILLPEICSSLKGLWYILGIILLKNKQK